jgi:hypothetical protein
MSTSFKSLYGASCNLRTYNGNFCTLTPDLEGELLSSEVIPCLRRSAAAFSFIRISS